MMSRYYQTDKNATEFLKLELKIEVLGTLKSIEGLTKEDRDMQYLCDLLNDLKQMYKKFK